MPVSKEAVACKACVLIASRGAELCAHGKILKRNASAPVSRAEPSHGRSRGRARPSTRTPAFTCTFLRPCLLTSGREGVTLYHLSRLRFSLWLARHRVGGDGFGTSLEQCWECVQAEGGDEGGAGEGGGGGAEARRGEGPWNGVEKGHPLPQAEMHKRADLHPASLPPRLCCAARPQAGR